MLAWFWEIDGFRRYDRSTVMAPGFASATNTPMAVSPSEIEAWARTIREPVEAWEFAALYAMDRSRRNALLAPYEAPKPGLTVAAFDAMFG